MSIILLLSGGADYADPWHPFAETSATASSIRTDDGHEVSHRHEDQPGRSSPAS